MDTHYKVKIMLVVGARPNFMKAAALIRAFRSASRFRVTLLHTGQHYDKEMSDQFFQDLRLPKPDVFLGIGSGTHAEQTAKIMLALEPEMLKLRPDLLLVVGDVNSTVAAALTASKLMIPVCHVEAGLRSFDPAMPEEVNRKVTDVLSDFLFVTEKAAIQNLLNEGVSKKKIYFVGNVMVDTLMTHLEHARERSRIRETLGVTDVSFALLTLHRPSNVDSLKAMRETMKILELLDSRTVTVFPCHPRTRARIEQFGFSDRFSKLSHIKTVLPLGYDDFLHLMMHATVVLTDSGGIQEETTVLGVPCLTLRENTERPVTTLEGTNTLVGRDLQKITHELDRVLKEGSKKGRWPRLWDGRAAERIVKVLEKHFVPLA